MIPFDHIPEAIRYPGAYIEIDGSQAGLGGDLPSVLLVGQKLPSGTAPAGEIVRISSVQDAIDKAGVGSMLAQMAARYRAVEQVFDLFMLPYSDNSAGVQATGTLAITTPATAAGTLAVYVAGRVVSVGVDAGQVVDVVAANLVAAINAIADLPVTAAAVAGVVTLTAKHKGTCGNDVDVRFGLYGEPMPTGLTISITAMSGGTGNPAAGDIRTILGQTRYWYMVLGFSDAATLAAWHIESQYRYQPPIQAGFRAFAAHRGDYASDAAFGETKNYEHISTLAIGINPTPTWEAAAIYAAAASTKLYANPVESLEGTPLPGMVATTYHDFTNANSLLWKGMSVLEYAKDGSCFIKMPITMYQRRSDGSADDAYLYLNTPEVMERIRTEQRIGAIQAFRGTAAAKTNEGYRPGLRITTADDVRAYLLNLYKEKLMRQNGWVQAYDYYKATLVVEQDPLNPSRFNYVDKPVILSPFYILAGRAQFRKAVPV